MSMMICDSCECQFDTDFDCEGVTDEQALCDNCNDEGDEVTAANGILNQIERSHPENERALDEIDARVWCYIQNYKYIKHKRHEKRLRIKTDYSIFTVDLFATRSRDALKVIRPRGWEWYLSPGNAYTGYVVFGGAKNEIGKDQVESPALPTEELAELHAIIQAISQDSG